VASLVVSFQFFRMQNCRLFNRKAFCCVLSNKEKYYSKLNRYSLVQITFVYLPVIAANIYNLIYTFYGRQVFWIDIESIITTCLMFIFHIIVIIRTENLYSVDKFEGVPQNSQSNKGQTVGGYTDIFGEGSQKEGPEGMMEERDYRKEALNKIIGKIRNNQEALELFGMQYTDQERFGKELRADGLILGKDGEASLEFEKEEDEGVYKAPLEGQDDTMHSIRLSQPEKADGSSSQGNKKPYQSENRFRNKKASGQMTGVGIYNKLAQESFRDTSRIDIQSPFQRNQFVQSKNQQELEDSSNDEIVLTTHQALQEMDYTSAPMNAQHMLKKNPELQQRYFMFQKELDERYNEKAKNQMQKSPFKTYQQSLKHFASNNIPVSYTSASRSKKFYLSQGKNVEESGSKVGTEEGKELEYFENLNVHEEDQVMAQNNRVQKYEITKQKKKLEPAIMEDIKRDIQVSKKDNNMAKKQILTFIAENHKLLTELNEERAKKDDSQRVVDELQRNIDRMRKMIEENRLKRLQDLQFIEHAHYTSDEEEMGISPSNYDVLNQRFNSKEDMEVYLNTKDDGFGEIAGSSGRIKK